MPDRDVLRRRLDAGLAALPLELCANAIERLLAYIALLQRWNATYNLSAVRDPLQMVTRHLLDSLAIAPWVEGESLADLGSGAGLPGIPLALMTPRRRVTLVDSNGKKARFLRAAVRELELANVEVVESRVEELNGTFDCITARAFSSLPEMLVRGGHLLAADGVWLAQKGRLPQDELEAVPQGFRVDAIIPLMVPGLDAQRHLVLLRRQAHH